jgi:hypothetical protein
MINFSRRSGTPPKAVAFSIEFLKPSISKQDIKTLPLKIDSLRHSMEIDH